MKNQLYAVLSCAALILTVTSCQKKYERLDLQPAIDTTSTGGGGTTPSTVALLVKMESKTTGSSEASTSVYSYNGSSKLIKVNTVNIDSAGKSTTTYYVFQRDANGKINKIITNELSVNSPGAGLPDSLGIYVHYPSASTYFDYATYSFDYSGSTIKDSIAYRYNNNVITEQLTYRIMPGSTVLYSYQQYVYKNNNLVAEKVLDPSTSTLIGTYTFDFDSKTGAMFTGNDAFLPGQDPSFASKNNVITFTANDNTNGTILFSASYTYKYNTNNMPTSATVAWIPGNGQTTATFTYQ